MRRQALALERIADDYRDFGGVGVLGQAYEPRHGGDPVRSVQRRRDQRVVVGPVDVYQVTGLGRAQVGLGHVKAAVLGTR